MRKIFLFPMTLLFLATIAVPLARAEEVPVGDVLYGGRIYRSATALKYSARMVCLNSPLDGITYIPWGAAPKRVLAKLGDEASKSALTEIPWEVGENDSALSKRYGQSQASVTPIPPATKARAYRTETLSIDAHFAGDKIVLFVVTRRGGALSPMECDNFLAQCGGTWGKATVPPATILAMWARDDGALATLNGRTLFVQSAGFTGRLPGVKR